MTEETARLAALAAAADTVLLRREIDGLDKLADAELVAIRDRAAAAVETVRPRPAAPAEVYRGWRIAARHLRPTRVVLLDDEDAPYEVHGLWDVIVVHEGGEAREFEAVMFGANEPNMLRWCVEQIEGAKLREAVAAQRSEYNAAREALGLGGE